MMLSRNNLVRFLLFINGVLVGVFLIQTFYLKLYPLEVSLEQVLTLALTSAIVYFTYLQSQYMAQQTRYHLEQNRPRFKIIHRSDSEFLLTNIGKSAAWSISVIFYKRTYQDEAFQDSQITGKAIEMMLPDETHLLNVDEVVLDEIRRSLDFSLMLDLKYDDLPKNGYRFHEQQIVSI